MPVSISKQGGKYVVKTPSGTKAKGTTRAKAQRQANLLRAVEHGWKPTGKKARDIRKPKRHNWDNMSVDYRGPGAFLKTE